MSAASAHYEKERDTLLTRLKQSRDIYLRTLKGVSDQAAQASPGGDAWPIMQIAEHVAVAERQMLTMWLKYSQPGSTDPSLDEKVAKGIVDRSNKQKAPDPSLPKGRMSSLAQAVEQFDFFRGQTIGYVEGTSDDLRGKVVQHPLAGTLDGYQLFLLMAGHAERHAAQIEELKQQQK